MKTRATFLINAVAITLIVSVPSLCHAEPPTGSVSLAPLSTAYPPNATNPTFTSKAYLKVENSDGSYGPERPSWGVSSGSSILTAVSNGITHAELTNVSSQTQSLPLVPLQVMQVRLGASAYIRNRSQGATNSASGTISLKSTTATISVPPQTNGSYPETNTQTFGFVPPPNGIEAGKSITAEGSFSVSARG